MRWRADLTAVMVAAVLIASCTSAPPPSTTPTADEPLEHVETRELDAPGELRADGLERTLRQATLRVRTRGCLGVTSGSAFALDDRLLVTNRHVVAGASEVQVSTWDGRSFTTGLVSVAVHDDLALVRVDDPLPTTLPLGSDTRAGDEVTVVGYPLGGAVTIEPGTVVDEAPGRVFDELGPVVRLEAHVEQGSSGGPVVDADGRVGAVIFALDLASGLALAVPTSTLEAAMGAATFVPVPSIC